MLDFHNLLIDSYDFGLHSGWILASIGTGILLQAHLEPEGGVQKLQTGKKMDFGQISGPSWGPSWILLEKFLDMFDMRVA